MSSFITLELVVLEKLNASRLKVDCTPVVAEVKKDVASSSMDQMLDLRPLVFVEVFDPVINWGRRRAHFLSEEDRWCKYERIVWIGG